MIFELKNRMASITAALVLSAASGTIMAQNPLENFLSGMKKISEQGEKDRAAIRANQQTSEQSRPATPGNNGNFATAGVTEEAQATSTQISLPKDRKTTIAVEEAMPLIKKIVTMHRCMKNNGDMRQWNFDAPAGVDMMTFGSKYWPKNNLPIEKMEFHDNSKCLSAKVIDQFSKPAENALLFRAVYFADDSGETDNFLYLFVKTDDGWKIRQLERGRK